MNRPLIKLIAAFLIISFIFSSCRKDSSTGPDTDSSSSATSSSAVSGGPYFSIRIKNPDQLIGPQIYPAGSGSLPFDMTQGGCDTLEFSIRAEAGTVEHWNFIMRDTNSVHFILELDVYTNITSSWTRISLPYSFITAVSGGIDMTSISVIELCRMTGCTGTEVFTVGIDEIAITGPSGSYVFIGDNVSTPYIWPGSDTGITLFTNAAGGVPAISHGLSSSSSSSSSTASSSSSSSVSSSTSSSSSSSSASASSSSSYNPTPGGKKVVILGGQSNMRGKGVRTNLLAWQQPVPLGVTYYHEAVGEADFNQYTSFFSSSFYFGPEIMFTHLLTNDWTNFAVIKTAKGSTTLGDWVPGGALYAEFMSNIFFALNDLGGSVEIMGLVWMQGESDCYSSIGSNYYNNFSNFIHHVRSDLGTPNLPVIFGLATPPVDSWRPDVNTAQSNFVNDDLYSTLVQTQDVSRITGDEIHYDSAGQIDLGTRFYTAFKNHLGL